jgi:hypothetical protein
MITLEGLRKLLKLKNMGKPLPEGWEEEVKRYLEIKRMYPQIYKEREHKELRERAKMQLAEAEGIYKLLCQSSQRSKS